MGDTARRVLGGYIWNEHINSIRRQLNAIRQEVENVNNGGEIRTGLLNIVLATVDADSSVSTLEQIAAKAKPAAGG